MLCYSHSSGVKKYTSCEVGPFKSLMAPEKKLFLSWLVRDLRLLYLFPDGRIWKRVCPVFMWSLIMLAVFQRQQKVQTVNGREDGLRDGLGYTQACL